MRSLLATAAAATMLLTTAAFAQNATVEYYTTGEGDNMMVMGGDMSEGARVMGDDTYAMPSDCPEGSYYRSGENMLTACGEGGASFEVTSPESGAMMSSGEAYPQGARVMTPRESGEQKQAN